MRNKPHLLLITLLLAISPVAQAQDYEDMLSDVLRSAPGRERSMRLTELSARERQQGRVREAVEFAIMGTSEAERHGLDKELSAALLELAKAHQQRGDIDHAIGTTIRVTMVNGTFHSGLRTEALLQLADLYLIAGHPNKAMEHLSEAAATTAAGRMDRSRFLRTEARAKAMVLEPEATIVHLERQLGEVERSNDRKLLLDMLSLLATAQAKAGRNADALISEERVMHLAIALDQPLEAGICANNLGTLHHRMGRTQEALLAFNKGLIMVEDLPYVRLTMQLNAAHAHAQGTGHEAAVRLVDDALRTLKSGKHKELLPRTLRTLAAIYLLKTDLTAAQNAALEALSAAESSGNDEEQALACELLSTIFERRDLPTEARSYERKAHELEQRRSRSLAVAKTDRESQLLRLQRIEREQVDILNREQRKEAKLKQLALDSENREKQFALLIYEKQLEESARREALLAREQAGKELQLTQAALEAERQERMIQELDNSRILQTLSMAKLESEQQEQQRAMEQLEERNALVEAEQRREQVVKRFSVMLAVGALLAASWMTWAWLITRRKKRTIWHQNQQIKGINDELAEKNNNIQSSLKYAQTIQSAILPSENDIRQALPGSFLMYKPLDKVSGDLPYIKRVGNCVYLAAIDCTGHGVPAAMMTFIAYYGLNDLIGQFPDATCGTLLDKLHEHVKSTMDNRENGGMYNDGMDIGLCRIDLSTGRIQFAGAQLSLIIVRNGDVIRVKGDILPLGDDQFQRSQGYQDHDLELRTHDDLFLFSDGIIHQFGGADGRKKFSMKRLSELLARSSGTDLGSLKNEAESEFEAWMGSTPQTDDVLMIGLRYAA